MNDGDRLRDSLAQISDQAQPVDFIERSLSRSRRIGRNKRILSGAAAVVALVMVGGLVWQLGGPGPDRTPPAVEQSASASESPSPSVPTSPSSTPSTGAPTPASVAGLPGWLYYSDQDRMVRLTTTGAVTVSGVRAITSSLSPDGASIAFFDDDSGSIVVTDRDGRNRRTMLTGAAGHGYEPAWSPDSRRLLVVKGTPGATLTVGIVTVASGTFVPLPHQFDGAHILWSADGKHLAYSTGTCQIGTADADGGNARIVPVLGDENTRINPQKRRACDPYSVSPDGRYVAVNQRTGDETNGDIARDNIANTVIDTRTGDNVTLPVLGQINAIRFQPNGEILVRANGKLRLLNADRTVKTQITEPTAVKNMNLIGYTP